MSAPLPGRDGTSIVCDALASMIGDVATAHRLAAHGSSHTIAPATQVRALGEPVTDVLVIESGVFLVGRPGEPSRWATAGSVIGLAEALSAKPSSVRVTALRHGRLTRIAAAALRAALASADESMTTVARLAQQPDHALTDVPPEPLIITVLLEHYDEAMEAVLTGHVATATAALDDARCVALPAAHSEADDDLAQELAAHEHGARTVVYIVRGADGARAAHVVAHSDRVLVIQPSDIEPDSAAYAIACDGSPRRQTDLVYLGGHQSDTRRTTTQLRRPPKVRRIHLMPEATAAGVSLLLAERRRSARDHQSLRDFEVLAGLDDAELAWIQSELRWDRVDGGSTLLRQGDSADAAWLVRAGRLEMVRRTSAGERHVAWLGPGAFVADAALFTEGPRSTSVRAVRDSTVARLDRTAIELLLARSVPFARGITRLLAAGATTSASVARRATTFTIVPLTDPVRTRAFVAELAAACGQGGLYATVVDAARLDAALGEGASHTRRGDVGDAEIIAWLDALERRHDAVILTCEATVDSWTRRAVRQGDHILLIADATSSPELRPIERELLGVAAVDVTAIHRVQGSEPRGFSRARHLVLLQPGGISEASGTSAWLAPRPDHVHHHVRAVDGSDLARLARRVTGRAVVLALSGASSRAPAHFGIVRAMDEHGLPIDVVSGSSSGAGVAALLAAGMRAETGLDRAMEIIRSGAPRLAQFQPPLTALTSGKAADRSLQAVFGDRLLEDQLIPAVLAAVDIRRHRAVHLTQGPIWKLVRASGALPLLWPPVWHDGDLLVDGGIINYLPTDVFGDEADRGLIVASNLDEMAGIGAPAFEGTQDYGTVANGWAELRRRMLGSHASRPPAIIDILFHSMGIPSFQQQEGLAALNERDNVCVITPTLGSFGLFEVTDEIGRRLEATTFEHARLALRDVAARWHARRVVVNTPS
jgi:NTE family protein